MNWRPPNWKNPHPKTEIEHGWSVDKGKSESIILANPYHYEFEAGADAMLKAQLPLLKQVYAQLCGVKLEQRRADGNVLDWYSALDESIDKLKPMVMEAT